MSVRYAGFWIRLIADIIDSLVLTALSWLLEYILLGMVYGVWALYMKMHAQLAPPFSDAFNPFYLQIVNVGLYFCLAFPYYVWGHFYWGTTLGKRPFNIYVVSADTLGPITIKQSMVRFFSYLISYLPFCAGFLMAAIHPKKQGLHELVAGTVSVNRSSFREV